MSQRPYDIVFCHLQVFNIVRWEVGSTCWCFHLGVQLYPLTSPTHTPPGNLHSCFLYATSPSQQSLSIRCKVSWHLFSLPNSSISIASIFSSPIHSLAHSNPLPDLSTPGFQTSFFFFFQASFYIWCYWSLFSSWLSVSFYLPGSSFTGSSFSLAIQCLASFIGHSMFHLCSTSESLETGQPNMTWEKILYLNSLIYSTNIYVHYLFIIKITHFFLIININCSIWKPWKKYPKFKREPIHLLFHSSMMNYC